MDAEEFFISTEKSKLDISAIHQFLSEESYWARGRSLETVEKSIKNALCFAVYNQMERQVGFARVVSDFAVFAWILDLFILPPFRGKGLGKFLVKTIMDYPGLQGLQRWGLATQDAHGLYERYGFSRLKNPEIMMEIVNKPR